MGLPVQRAAQFHDALHPENVSVGPGSQSVAVSSLVLHPILRRSSLLHTAFFTATTASPIFALANMLSLVTFLISFFLGLAAAQSTAVTWIEPGATGAFAYAASVADACPGTTVLALQCTSAGPDAPVDGLCVTDGPVRLEYEM